jgi:hypothetical protein
MDHEQMHRDAERKLGIVHRDGVPWHAAPRPRRLHRCSPQTAGTATTGTYIERCACGAIRLDGYGSWDERNSRTR